MKTLTIAIIRNITLCFSRLLSLSLGRTLSSFYHRVASNISFPRCVSLSRSSSRCVHGGSDVPRGEADDQKETVKGIEDRTESAEARIGLDSHMPEDRLARQFQRFRNCAPDRVICRRANPAIRGDSDMSREPMDRPRCQCSCNCPRRPGVGGRRTCISCSRLIGPGCCWMGDNIRLCHVCYYNGGNPQGRSERSSLPASRKPRQLRVVFKRKVRFGAPEIIPILTSCRSSKNLRQLTEGEKAISGRTPSKMSNSPFAHAMRDTSLPASSSVPEVAETDTSGGGSDLPQRTS